MTRTIKITQVEEITIVEQLRNKIVVKEADLTNTKVIRKIVCLSKSLRFHYIAI